MKQRMKRNFGLMSLLLLCCLVIAAAGITAASAAASKAPDAATGATQAANSAVVLPYGDVDDSAWYAEAVYWCRDNGIMDGISKTAFAPDNLVDRSMIVTVLYRAAGKPEVSGTLSFSDTVSGAWYSDALLWAAGEGLVAGYNDGRFGVRDTLTWEQTLTVLWRNAGSPAGAPAAAGEDAVSAYALEAVRWAYGEGLVFTGEGGFTPKAGITRADLAAVLQRSLTKEAPSTVYITRDISSEGLMAVYEALEEKAEGESIAVKLSTGEPGSNYLRPELIAELVQSVKGTIVECNTAYGGSRDATAMHYQVAKDHGFTDIADVDIMDENGYITLPVEGGTNLEKNYVGANFENYDYFVVLSHFKGHGMAGYGGAIKNISIGIASSMGKRWIHSGGTSTFSIFGKQDPFLESMAEAGKSVVDALDGNILYINVMNRLSVDCDCVGNPAEPDMHDIGILASLDPVALDQACIDLVYAAEDGGSLIERIESKNGLHTLEHAEEIGLGSRTYTLLDIDEEN